MNDAMGQPPKIGGLGLIESMSGVNDALDGFCTIRAVGEVDGRTVSLIGQIDPTTVRELAMQFLESAEASESDSIVAKELIETVGLPMEQSLMFIAALRARRA